MTSPDGRGADGPTPPTQAFWLSDRGPEGLRPPPPAAPPPGASLPDAPTPADADPRDEPSDLTSTGPLPVLADDEPADADPFVQPYLRGPVDAAGEDADAYPVVAAADAVDDHDELDGPAGARPLSRAGRAGLGAAVAVAAVVAGIVAVHVASSGPSTAVTGSPAFVLPSGPASHAAAVGTPPGLAALPPAAATSSPAGAASGAPPAPAADAPAVTVLNQTRTKGLGGKEADRLRAAGWNVRRVTNVRAVLPQTTVFYDAGQEAAARELRATVPSVRAAEPRPRWLLRTGGLIVVVATDAA